MSNITIRRLLETRLKSQMDVIDPSIEIAWEDTGYSPTFSKPYIKPVLIPERTFNPVMGGKHYRSTGSLLVSVFFPEGQGPNNAETLANALMGSFPIDTRLTDNNCYLRVTHTPFVSGGSNSDGWFYITVQIHYQFDNFN